MRVSVGRGAGGDHYSWRLLWKVIGGADKSAGGWHGGRAGARPSREAQEARPAWERRAPARWAESDSCISASGTLAGTSDAHPPGRRSAGALPPSSNTMRLVDPLELQIPHPVAQPLATLLELGDRPLVRAGNVGAIGGLVAVTRCGVHYLEHVLGVMRPVGGHVQHTADLQLAPHQLGKGRRHDAPLVVLLLVPGVGEAQQYPVQTGIGNGPVEHLDGVAIVDPHIAQAVVQQAIEQGPDTRAVHLDTDE